MYPRNFHIVPETKAFDGSLILQETQFSVLRGHSYHPHHKTFFLMPGNSCYGNWKMADHDMKKRPSNLCNSWSVQMKYCISCKPQSCSSISQPSSVSMLQTSDNLHLECIRRQITAICYCKWSAKKIRSLRREGAGHNQPKYGRRGEMMSEWLLWKGRFKESCFLTF